MTSRPEAVVLIDFDGTLLRGNSFHLWLRFIASGRLRTIPIVPRLFCKARVVLFAFLRLARVINHAQLKFGIQKSWDAAVSRSPQPSREMAPFVDSLLERVDPDLLEEIRTLQDGGAKTVLTTAAVAEYAVPVAQRLGFDAVVSTPPFGHDPWFHNIGVRKMKETFRVLENYDWESAWKILYTDHEDDQPLMARVDEIHLVAEDQPSMERLSRAVPGDKRVYFFRSKDIATP